MRSARDIARRGGSAAEVATAEERTAVSEGIAVAADKRTLTAAKRRGAAAKADRVRQRVRLADDVAFDDGERDLSDDALEVLEDRVRERYYERHIRPAIGGDSAEEGATGAESAQAEGQVFQNGISGREQAGVMRGSSPGQDVRASSPRHGRSILEGREGRPARRGPAARSERARHLRAGRSRGPEALRARQRKANLRQALAAGGAEGREAAAATRAARVARGASDRGVASVVASAMPALAGAATALLAFVIAALLVGQILGSLFGFWKHEDDKRRLVAGLPPYITYEMVVTALEMQDEYGHPAGATLAQIILESGVGDHLSGLATRDNNLFGIKWNPSFGSCPEVTGYESWRTNEEYDGQIVTITDAFTCFASHRDCIVFRSRVFLQMGLYRNNPIIQEAMEKRDSDLMVEGLKDAGYATSSEYVSSLKSVMDMYGLRRFDSMTKDDFDAEMAGGVTGAVLDGDATPRQQAAVNAAYAETYCVGGYCAEYVMRVYERIGIGRAAGGDARDIYWRWCTSSDLSTLKPGMVIAVPAHAGTRLGAIYGHVAVYVGGGMVRDNVGYIRMTPVADWIAYYSSITAPKWGWYGGVVLG